MQICNMTQIVEINFKFININDWKQLHQHQETKKAYQQRGTA